MPVQTHAQNARNGKVIALNPPPVKEKKKLKNASDFLIIFFTMLLVVIGLIMVYDSSYYVAQQTSEFEYDGAYFLKKQLVGAAAGIAAMTVCAMLDYRQWRRFVLPLLIGALILMVMVWVPGYWTEYQWFKPLGQDSGSAKYSVFRTGKVCLDCLSCASFHRPAKANGSVYAHPSSGFVRDRRCLLSCCMSSRI